MTDRKGDTAGWVEETPDLPCPSPPWLAGAETTKDLLQGPAAPEGNLFRLGQQSRANPRV